MSAGACADARWTYGHVGAVATGNSSEPKINNIIRSAYVRQP